MLSQKNDQWVFLADLNHHKRSSFPYFFPLGVGYVGAYLQENLKEVFKVELFRYSEDLSSALETRVPKIIGFSNFLWNLNLSYKYIEIIKKRHPQVVTVMGGPNYDLNPESIEAFWKKYPAIDFYITLEGEHAFLELVKVMQRYGFDANAVKKNREPLPNCHYISGNEIIQGEVLPRSKQFDQLPSPYLTGLMDKFFDGQLTPLIQTARGCPFQCTFCSEGLKYYNQVEQRLNLENELEYIAQRTKTPNLCFADANWGMYREDIEKAKTIVKIQEKYNWPEHIYVNVGKNKKERILEISDILNHCFHTGGAVQTTDKEVLKNIKRSNIALPDMAKTRGSDSYAEIMVGLPGETLKSHARTLRDLVDNGYRKFRVYQTILLPHTSMNSPEERKKYEIKTKYQILTRAFGRYTLWDETFSAVEYQELSIANNAMTMEEYFDCRELDLTLEAIYNKMYTLVLFNLFKGLGLSWFDVIYEVYKARRKFTPALAECYDAFRRSTISRLWDDPDKLVSDVTMNLDNYLLECNDHKDMTLGYGKELLLGSNDFTNLFFSKMKKSLHHAGLMNLERIHNLNAMRYLWNISTLQSQ